MNAHAVEVWRMAGGSAQRCGLAPKQADRLKWRQGEGGFSLKRLALEGSALASPVFTADGRMFCADRAGWAYGFDASRERLWQRALPAGVEAAPALSDDDQTLFLATLGGDVLALETGSGERIWKATIPSDRDPRIESDLLYHSPSGTVIASSWAGEFIALEAKTGTYAQRWQAGVRPRSAMAADESGWVYGMRVEWRDNHRGGTRLFRVNPTDGASETIYYEPSHTSIPGDLLQFASPIICGDWVIAIINRNNDSRLYVFDLESEAHHQSELIPTTFIAAPALLADQTLALAGLDGQVYRLSLPQTELLQTLDLEEDYLQGAPVATAEGHLFIGTPTGDYYMIPIAPNGGGLSSPQQLLSDSRAFAGRAAFHPGGALVVPGSDHQIYWIE